MKAARSEAPKVLDPRAVGKAVVWLANEQTMSRANGDGNVDPYQHEVDIDEKDPDLFIDQPFETLMSMAGQDFGEKSDLRWFFYLRPLKVQVVRTWDPKSGRYV